MIKITTNADLFSKLVDNLKNDIANELIPNGLDKPLNESLEDLKSRLLAVVNEEIRFDKKVEERSGEEPTNLPMADSTIIKTFFGYDLDKVKLGSYSKDSFDNGVVFTQSFKEIKGEPNLHARVFIPSNDGDTVETLYNKAVDHFKDSIYIDNTGSKPRYFILTDLGRQMIERQTKIVCSTLTGIEDGKALVKANKRRSKEVKKGLNYSRWALKQEALKKILDPYSGWSTEITDFIEDIKVGKLDQGSDKLIKSIAHTRPDIVEKIKEVKQGKGPKEFQSFQAIINLINSLRLSKKLEPKITTYTLVGDFENSIDMDKSGIFEIIQREGGLWLEINSLVWLKYLIDLITEYIVKHLGG